MGTAIKHPVPERVKPSFVIFDIRALTLRAERQSAWMPKITNDGLTRSGTGCFIAVPMRQQWASNCSQTFSTDHTHITTLPFAQTLHFGSKQILYDPQTRGLAVLVCVTVICILFLCVCVFSVFFMFFCVVFLCSISFSTLILLVGSFDL